MDAKSGQMLDFGAYFIALLFIMDIYCIFHNFSILYLIHILASGGKLCFWLCILTVLTM
jgi:hypothetical protein